MYNICRETLDDQSASIQSFIQIYDYEIYILYNTHFETEMIGMCTMQIFSKLLQKNFLKAFLLYSFNCLDDVVGFLI